MAEKSREIWQVSLALLQDHRKIGTIGVRCKGCEHEPWTLVSDLWKRWRCSKCGSRDVMPFAVELMLSPKPPSSGMATDWQAFDDCVRAAGSGPACVLKIAVFDDDDYAYAHLAANRHPALPVYLQVGNPAPVMAPEGAAGEEADIDDLMHRFRWLVGKVAADQWFTATVLPQRHVLAWGSRRGI